MILVTLISTRIIDYGTLNTSDNLSVFDKIIKSLSSISYEVYLVQYPVIFLFQYAGINNNLKILLTIYISFP